MKKCLLLFLVLLTVASLMAQDLIVFTSGQEVQVTVKKVGVTTIEYVKFNNPTGPTYEVLKSDVVQIVYKNGTTDVFSIENKGESSSGVVNNGAFIDARDGVNYKWVRIGKQIWMGENLRFDDKRSPCIVKDDGHCSRYGRYYQFEDAMNACPNGWKLPSDEDWMDLEIEVGMSPEKARKEGWRGTPPGQAPLLLNKGYSGLNLLLCGYATKSNFSKKNPKYAYEQLDEHAYYWTSTQENNTWFLFIRHFKGRASIGRETSGKKNRYSVRCIKNHD